MIFTNTHENLALIKRRLAPSTFALPEAAIQKQFNRLQLQLPADLAGQIAAALNSGKHIILIGAPGVAKTVIAQALCAAAQERLLSFGEGVLATATSDWTTSDTVGGYMPKADGRGLEFVPGVITRAIKTRRWLIIDEINRADIDKAIGSVFSVLSGQEVELAFRSSTLEPIRIAPGIADSTESRIVIHPFWRLIGTMNDVDKQSLYSMSYAFLRRFALIQIPTPEPAEIKSIVATHVPECDLTKGLDKLMNIRRFRLIGPALFIDMAKYIVSRAPKPNQTPQHTREAFALFLLPQLDAGVPKEVRPDITRIIVQVFPDFKFGSEFSAFKGTQMETSDSQGAPDADGNPIA